MNSLLYRKTGIAAVVAAGLVALALVLGSAQVALALGTNGSFELGTDPGSFSTHIAGDSSITDWTINSGSVDYVGSYWAASSGARSLDLNGTTTGSVSQVIPTTVGATYQVTFDLSGNPDTSADPSLTSPSLKDVRVDATGAAPQDFTFDTAAMGNTHENMMWQGKTYSFVATTSSTTVTFTSQIVGAFGPAVDNVAVTQASTSTPTSTVTVTINKFIDGSMATTGSANSASFPMQSLWDADNIGAGSGTYELDADGFNSSSTPYQAVTTDMTSGADYTTSELMNTSSVGASCADGKPFALSGYSSGDTLVQAQQAATSSQAPNLTNITTNKHIIVWNIVCAGTTTPPTPPAPIANACATPGVAPAGYTLVNGSSRSDNVTLASGTMYVGRGGNDHVAAGDGNYIVCLGSGNDHVSLGDGNSVVDAGGGNNQVEVGDGTTHVKAGSGNDQITTGSGNDTVNAGGGNNQVTTNDGNDSITTGSGNDTANAGSGQDTCALGGGNNNPTSCEL